MNLFASILILLGATMSGRSRIISALLLIAGLAILLQSPPSFIK